MSKSGLFGMRFHQGLSFSRPLMRMSRAKAVFWPGCALMNLDPAILQKTFAALRRAEPELGLSTCCCGQPSRYLFQKKFSSRSRRLARSLASHGVARVYTACPNCAVQLRELGGVEVVPIWQTLAEVLRPEDIRPLPENASVVLHDPCPMRREPAQLDAVRQLCRMAGAKLYEPAHNREHSICCGNFHMMHTLDPEKSAGMRKARLAEFPKDTPVASCCEGCLGSFRIGGREGVHILELLFGRSEKRGWKNRLSFTRAQR